MKTKKEYGGLSFGLSFILSFLLLLLIAILLSLTPLFNIKYFEVNGSRHYNKDTLIEIAGIVAGSNGFRNIGGNIEGILSLRYIQAEKNILENCPYVKTAVVKYLPPSSVRIDITEREAAFNIPYFGTSLLIDSQGYVIDTIPGGKAEELPDIEGLEFENYELGHELRTKKPEALEAAINVMEIIKESDKGSELKIMRLVKSINVSDLDNVYVFIDSRIVVNLGNLEDLRYRVEVMKHIFFKNLKSDEKGLLDFTESENPILKKQD